MLILLQFFFDYFCNFRYFNLQIIVLFKQLPQRANFYESLKLFKNSLQILGQKISCGEGNEVSLPIPRKPIVLSRIP